MAEPYVPRDSRYNYTQIHWTIRGFFNGMYTTAEVFESSEFLIKSSTPLKFKLRIIGMKDFAKGTKLILQRSPTCKGPERVIGSAKLLLKGNSKDIWTVLHKELNMRPGESVTVTCNNLLNDAKDHSYPTFFSSGTVKVICDILLESDPIDINNGANENLRHLSEDLYKYYSNGKLCDLRLITDDKVFEVHSAITIVRSPYIWDILRSYPHKREIDLRKRGFLTSQVEGLIHYWYTGDWRKIPMILAPSTYKFLRSMKQDDIIFYFAPSILSQETTFHTLEYSMKWYIQDSAFLDYLTESDVTSCRKYSLLQLPWKLHIYPSGVRQKKDYVTIFIEENERIPPLHPVYLELFFTDKNGNVYNCKSNVSCLCETGIYSFPRFIKRVDFGKLKKLLLDDNTLRIGCKIKYGTGGYQTGEFQNFGPIIPAPKHHPYVILAITLGKLLESGKMSDISLQSGDRIFKVHTPVLAARSDYFNLKINEMRELLKESDDTKECGPIIIDEIEPNSLDLFLRYLYSAERIELNIETALKFYHVFRACKKLDSKNCFWTKYLKEKLTAENALDVLQLADRYNDSTLKSSVSEVIRENWDMFKNDIEWKAFLITNGKLASEIFQMYCKKPIFLSYDRI